MNRWRASVASVIAVLAMASASVADARVTRLVVEQREPYAGGHSWGEAGPYERIVATAYFEVDPADPRNKVIVDLDKAPRNAAGKVEFSAPVFLIKPVDMARGNGKLFYDVNNRGNTDLGPVADGRGGSCCGRCDRCDARPPRARQAGRNDRGGGGRPAGALAAWTGVRDCNALGPKTPQGPITLPGIMGKVDPSARAIPVMMAVAGITNAKIPESEDCLVLNVITPDASRVRKRPVMVWLHGGAFAMGSGFDSMTDGSLLAGQGDVVYVSLNHRLNAMGFLYLGALHDDFADSGNAGMLDIVLALEWVRDNIEAFGGDPGNVTIFGQSGGGAKVSTLLGMLPAKGLFHKAIAMSGPIVTLVEKQDAAAIAEQTLASLGVAKADVHRLQTLPYGQIIQAASAVRLPPAPDGGLASRTLAPMVDGRSIPAHPFDPGATEISRDVPLMIGTAKDEATLFMAGDPELGHMSEDHARERFRAALGDKGDAAFERYRSGYPKDDPSYWVSTMMTDRLFRSQSIVQADRKSAQKAAAVYMYRVDYEPRVVDRILRSPHGTEVPLVFGTKVPVQFVSSGPEVDALSARLMRAWLNFVRTGSPSQEGLEWPRYDARRRLNMIFDAPCHVVADPDPVARDPVARGIA